MKTSERRTNMYSSKVDGLRNFLDKIDSDVEKDRRHNASECQHCFYNSGMIVGMKFTPFSCSICGTEGQHPNTGVPTLCKDCATVEKLCHQCGGDIDMNTKRKNWPSFKHIGEK